MNKANPSASQVVRIKGNHYQMGYQHGRQVRPLRPQIIKAIEARFARIAQDNPDEAFERLVQETQQVVHAVDPSTVGFIRGQADGLELEFEWLMRYNLISFLRDALTTRRQLSSTPSTYGEDYEGCTTWAVNGSASADGQPIVVKNRDYHLEHLPLQIVVRAEPAVGHRYMYVTSAGNPGVFVAGINEAGLAVVDTHVPCPNVGPGLPTFALSMHILEEHGSVHSALAYLQSVPRLGRNNLILADAEGHMAVFENSHHQSAVLEAEASFLIATNHFNSPAMKDCFVDINPPSLRGNTFERYKKVKDELTAAYGQIDVTMAQRLMASHDGPLASICRHPLPESGSSTISTVVFLPAQRQMLFRHGPPCQGKYEAFDHLR